MTEYFKKEILEGAKRHRKKNLIIYFSFVAAFVVSCLALFIWYTTLPYASPKITAVKLILYPLTVIFVIFSFIYLGISGKRTKKYYALCQRISVGIKERSEAEFLRYDDTLSTKDGVDVKSLVFSERNKYKGEFYERKVLLFYELPFPELEAGRKYAFITVGNVLFSYEEIK